jgi:hypothetical protein
MGAKRGGLAKGRAKDKFLPMSNVAEIKRAASELSEPEHEELLSWLLDLEAEWDTRIEKDAAEGKLDFLVQQARSAIESNTLRNWPGKA